MKTKIILLGFFLGVIILVMANMAFAFPITGKIIEIDATETVTDQDVCAEEGEYMYDLGHGGPEYCCPGLVLQSCTACPTGVLGTCTQPEPGCFISQPTFEILEPTIQEGRAGDTLIYDLYMKNNDVGCEERYFQISGSAPMVPPVGKTMDYCRGPNRDMCFWDGFYVPRSSSFSLEPQEERNVEFHLTSREVWPANSYFHFKHLNYGDPGEEVLVINHVDKNFIYRIIDEERTCPVGTVWSSTAGGCLGEEPVCPEGTVYDPNAGGCLGEEPVCPEGTVWSSTSQGCLGEERTCPENCICKGNTITCPTTQENPIEVEISTHEGSSNISIEKITEDTILIKEGLTSVKTSKKLVIKEKKLFMKTSKGNKEVKVMPSTASDVAINQLELKNYEIELKDVGKPVYEITGKKDVKVIGLIKAEMMIKSQINAETGVVGKTKKPWWSFLAKEE